MSLFGRLFGGGKSADKGVEAIEYNGFLIYPEPIKEGSEFRLAARIEQGEGETLKSHQVIRADTIRSHEEAVDASISKCKQVIDQMCTRIFD